MVDTSAQGAAIKRKILEDLGAVDVGTEAMPLPASMPAPAPPAAGPRNPFALSAPSTPEAQPGTETLGQGPQRPPSPPITMENVGERLVQPSNVRSALTAGGGIAGGLAGAPGGPATMIAGVGLGAAAGGYLANMIDDLRGTIDPATGLPPTDMDKLTGPLYDAVIDAGLSAAPVVGPWGVKKGKELFARLLKLPPNAKEVAQDAADIGLDIGVANLATEGPAHTLVNSLGRMPFVGAQAKASSVTQAKRIVAAKNDLFGTVMNESSMAHWSEEAVIQASLKFDDFAVKSQTRYDRAFQVGEKAGTIIKSEELRDSAGKALKHITERPGGSTARIPDGVRDDLDWIMNLPEKITTMEAYKARVMMETARRKLATQTNVTYEPLKEVEGAARSLLRRNTSTAAKAMNAADDFFDEGVTAYATPVGQKFGKIDRNIFGVGIDKPGTMNIDEFHKLVENTTSPTAVRQLRELSGDKTVHSLARQRLDDAWDIAEKGTEKSAWFGMTTRLKFDADKFSDSLGLFNKRSPVYRTTEEMLRGTDVTMDGLEKFARLAKAVGQAPLSDASTFVARGATLAAASGIAPAIKGVVTGGMQKVSNNLLKSITLVGIARSGVGTLMRPGLLNKITTVLEPDVPKQQAWNAFLQIITEVPSLRHLHELPMEPE